MKIIDAFTNLPVSRQRKHQLRHPERMRVLQKRFTQTEKGKQVRARSSKRYHEKNKEWKSEYYKQYYIKKNL